MADACILVKSPSPHTYTEAVKQLLERFPEIRSIEWLFLNTQNRNDILMSVSIDPRIATTVISIEGLEDLRPHLLNARYCDVSGLPKEDFAQLLGMTLGRSDIRLCTLTRDRNTPYVDLLSHPVLKAFNRGYIARLSFFKIVLSVVACGLVALALLKILDWFPNRDPWLTWLSIALSVFGAGLSYVSLKRK
jgi:hypothetical protein